jgi:hypothetical protein
VLVAVAALAVVTTLPRAVEYSLWQDEVASAEIAVEPTPGHVALEVALGESTPPAWYTLAWTIHHLGVPVEQVRLASVAFTVALAVLVVIYARRVLPLSGAALAALLVVLGWQFVRHGWELRSYALLALVGVALALAVERSAERPDRSRLAVLAGVVMLGSLTHYFFLFTLAASLAWVWTSASVRPARARLTAAVGVGLVPFLAWTPALAEQYGHQRFAWIGPFAANDVLGAYLALFASPRFAEEEILAGIVLLVVVLGAVVLWRRGERGAHCGLLVLVPVALAAAIWFAGVPIFLTRNLLAVGPFAAVAIAAAVAALPRRAALATGLVIGALAAALYVRHAP